MAHFTVTPVYSETVSTALARGGSLFEAKGGYLQRGDTFTIKTGSSYSAFSEALAPNTLGVKLKMGKAKSYESNPAHSNFKKPKNYSKGTSPHTGDAFYVSNIDPSGLGFEVRNWVDGDADSGGEPLPGDTCTITSPVAMHNYEVDEAITCTASVTQQAVDNSTQGYWSVRKLDGQTDPVVHSESFTPSTTPSTTITPDSFSVTPEDGNGTFVIELWLIDGADVVCTDNVIIQTRPDGEALTADYGRVTCNLWWISDDGFTTIEEVFDVVNSASGSQGFTINADLNGDDANGNPVLLSDSSINLMANGSTLGTDFGVFGLQLTSDQAGVDSVAVELGADMGLKIGPSGLDADSDVDNADTSISQQFQVLDASSIGDAVKMEIIADNGTAYTVAGSIDTSAGVGTYTQTINLATLDGGSNLTSGYNYRVKVTSNDDDDIYTYSEFFSVKPSLKSISLTAPTAGSESYVGDNLTVTWTSELNS